MELGHPRCELHPYERTIVASRNDKRDRCTLYDTRKWKRLRKSQLMKQPLCEQCFKLDMIVSATVVDHKRAHLGDLEMFYDTENLQSLCVSCHNRKTATQDGGFGNPRRRRIG